MIKHTVTFALKHEPGSPEEKDFLEAGKRLADIPVVNNFECLCQISDMSNFTFGFSMEFDSMEDYETYNNHPDHVAFVNDRWKPEVIEFLEIDYTAYDA